MCGRLHSVRFGSMSHVMRIFVGGRVLVAACAVAATLSSLDIGTRAFAYDVPESLSSASRSLIASPVDNKDLNAGFQSLALDLIKIAADIGDFPEVTLLPHMRRASHEELEDRVCQKRCAVKAAYFPDEGILLDRALELDESALDRSIVLHELVHYLQERSGRYADLPPCKRWYAREDEAYWVQQVYLKRVRSGTTLSFKLHAQCPKESASLN